MTAFTKLRGVHEDDIDTVIPTLIDQDWVDLETGFLDVVSLELSEVLDLLGLNQDRSDSVVVFWRLYQHMLNRTPEIAS